MEYNPRKEDAKKWYGYFCQLPKYTFIFIMACFFIVGTVDCNLINDIGDGMGTWFLYQIIGFIVAGITYIFEKIYISATILKVEYLREISENTKNNNNKEISMYLKEISVNTKSNKENSENTNQA